MASMRSEVNVRFVKRQRGAAAIEFALLFIPMFALFYALVSYGLIMALMQGMTLAAEEGARAAIAVDRTAHADRDDYVNNGVIPRVRERVGSSLDWLPESLKARVLGVNNELVLVSLNADDVLSVTVRYSNYSDAPLIPTLQLPGIGAVPRVGELQPAQANIQL